MAAVVWQDSVHEYNPFTRQGSGFTFEQHNEGDYRHGNSWLWPNLVPTCFAAPLPPQKRCLTIAPFDALIACARCSSLHVCMAAQM